jgi:hypothetical protein
MYILDEIARKVKCKKCKNSLYLTYNYFSKRLEIHEDKLIGKFIKLYLKNKFAISKHLPS